MPSPRACSMTFQPSRPGSIRSSTAPSGGASVTRPSMDPDSLRARMLFEESREAVIVLDDGDTVVLASRRARQTIEGINEGEPVPEGLLSGDLGIVPLIVPYDVGSR